MNTIPVNAVVWTEVPVSDLDKARAFYSAVIGTELKEMQMGPDTTYVFPCSDEKDGVAGHIYKGKPAAPGTGPTVHLSLSDTVEEGMKRVEAAGGKVVSPVIEIPAGRFAYCTDPDGNSIGIFSS